MNYQNENKIYEGFIVEGKNDSFVVSRNNKRIPVFVGLCAVLIILGIILFLMQLIDLTGFVIMLFIAGMFIYIGLRNRKNISVIFPIYNNRIVKIESINNIEVKTETRFSFNLLGLFMSYPYRIIFNLNNGSSIDAGINFGFEGSARNFLDFLKETLMLRNIEIKQEYNFQEKISRKTAIIFLITGLALVGINYFVLVYVGYVILWLIVLMSMAVLLGIFGIINPRMINFKNSNTNSNYESSSTVTLAVSIIGAIIGLAIYYFFIY
ncbi:MAG: hypothetical protein KAI67_03910 [Candidatus Pacebacteria bacterium]|nr:hypothetical protein [Candidatus Paceibacterota bacterium]